MKRLVTITFKTTSEIQLYLKKKALEDERTVSQTVSRLLSKQIQMSNKENKHDEPNKNQF